MKRKYTEEEIRGFFKSFCSHCENLSRGDDDEFVERIKKAFGGRSRTETCQEMVWECKVALDSLSRGEYFIVIEALDKFIQWYDEEIKKIPNCLLIFSSGYRSVSDSINMMRGMKTCLEEQYT